MRLFIVHGSTSTFGSYAVAVHSSVSFVRLMRSTTRRSFVWNAPSSVSHVSSLKLVDLDDERVAFPMRHRVAERRVLDVLAMRRGRRSGRSGRSCPTRRRRGTRSRSRAARSCRAGRCAARPAKSSAARDRSALAAPRGRRPSRRTRACTRPIGGGGAAATAPSRRPRRGSQPRTQTDSPRRCGCTKSMPEPLSQVPVRSGCPSGIRGTPSAAPAAAAKPERGRAEQHGNTPRAPRSAAEESELVVLCMMSSPD